MGGSVSMLLDIFPGRNYSGIKLWFKTKRFFHYFNDMYFPTRKIKGERVCVHFRISVWRFIFEEDGKESIKGKTTFYTSGKYWKRQEAN
jgi:hypothetical protein